MSYPEVLEKQPDEEVTRGADFTNLLIPGRTLDTCDPVVVTVHRQNLDETATPADLTVSAPVISGNIAQVKIEGGLDNASYKLTFIAEDSGGDVIEMEGILKVKAR